MKLLDDYFKLQQEIYEYFGYVEDWCVFPIDDRRDYYWSITGNEVYYCKSKENAKCLVDADYNWDSEGIDGMDVYCDDIYPNRFLPTAEYRAKDYSMILVDTNTDGNKFLAVYDNTKEIKSV